jgi:beta-lactamase regulating signal transducer with metallopeptidase domain
MMNFVLNVISPIFYKVLYMSIIGIFLGLFILIIRKVLDKKISPKWKCVIWLLLMVSLIIPIKFKIENKYINTEIISISGLVDPIQNISSNTKLNENIESNIDKELENEEQMQIEENTSTEGKNYNTYKIDFKDLVLNVIIPCCWIIGILFNLLLLVLGNRNIRRNIKGKVYNDSILENLIEESKSLIGVKLNVKVILQDFKKTPSIIGIFAPKILVTKEFLLQDYQTKKYIIMHELSHYKRKDLIFNYIILLITIIHWFNPFVWLYFKKIRQDIELATDEMVLDKLKNDEKKDYGMTLINSLKLFQEERYTAKLLCVTDDSKNMERRIKMVKLSEKFNKNKLLIGIVSIVIIIVGILLFFTENNNSIIQQNNNQNSIQNNEETSKKYEYKAFKPSFKKTSESTYDDYDFTQDMIWKDSIYYKKINTYEEYSEVKSRWNDILDMSESDFTNNFMIITAIENTSMVGLTVDKIETDNNNLYISLIHYEDGMNYNEEETCISYKISRDLERNNIYVTRNLRNNEKDMSEEMQLAEETATSQSGNLAYQYRTEEYRNAEKKISENPNSPVKIVPQDWKDMMSKKFTIGTDMPEIDFSTWNNLGNDFYSIAITDYSEYLKMINNYNAPQMSWLDFKYVYAIIIVRANADNTIDVQDIETENGKSYLNVSASGWLDVGEGFKYPAICVYVPNYRSLESSFLDVRVK